ncbi:MAG: methionyl-tRNA formyltransferase, partial [Patescibacteria group bacterium]
RMLWFLYDILNLMVQNPTPYNPRPTTCNFAFFGTDEFAVIVLYELKKAGFIPSLIITAPDSRKGRGMILTPPPVKAWAEKHGIKFLQPQKLDASFAYNLKPITYNLFIVASYGKILPKEILAIPPRGALNVHPSLLPLYRGPSPIQTQILESAEPGVTIMLMDEEVDHGPIVAQKALGFNLPAGKAGIYDLRFKNLRDELAKLGGRLLAQTIPDWIAGNTKPQEQKHNIATYTKIVEKEDGLIHPEKDAPEEMYRKFRAFSLWPGTYFFTERTGKKIRVKITDAELKDGQFIIKKIIPEGKKEIAYDAFLKN